VELLTQHNCTVVEIFLQGFDGGSYTECSCTCVGSI